MIAGDLVRFRGQRRSWLVLGVDGQSVTMTTGKDTRTAPVRRLEGAPAPTEPQRQERTLRRVVVSGSALPDSAAVGVLIGEREVVLLIADAAQPHEVAAAVAEMWPYIEQGLAGGDA